MAGTKDSEASAPVQATTGEPARTRLPSPRRGGAGGEVAPPARLPLSREIRALGRTLGSSAPYLVTLVALVVLALAYQVRPSYTIVAGSPTDAPYWRDIHQDEEDPAHQQYRWTTPHTLLYLQGVGGGAYRVAFDLTGSRPAGFPPPQVRISAGGQTLAALQPGPARARYEVHVPASATPDGDLRVTVETTNPFSPPGDKRQLGVVVYGVQIDPVGRDLALPPLDTWLPFTASAGLLALLLGLAGWGPGVVRAGGIAWALALAGFLLWDRLWITLIPGVLVQVLLIAGLLLLLLGPLWRLLYRAGGIRWPEAEQRGLLAIYGLAFVARMAGQLHPQIKIIDLLFHAHRFDDVLAGRLLFTIKSNEWGGHETFYLPTPYVFMLPLQWLLNDELLTIRLFTVALDTACVFLVYYLAKRAFGDGRAGLLAAGLLVTLPQAVLPFSWGITANLFGQFVGLAAIAIAVGCYERLTRPGPWLVLVGVLTAAMLSHPGNVQLTGALMGGAIVVWAWGSGIGRRGTGAFALGSRKAWLALAAALVASVLIAYVGYYSHFVASQLQQLQEIRTERAAKAATEGFSMITGGGVNDRTLGLIQRIARNRSTWLLDGVAGFAAEAWAYFHTMPIVWGALGLILAAPGRNPARRRMLWAAAVWAAVVVLYAAVGLLANLYVRYPLFLLPLVALGAGLLLSALWPRGRASQWLVSLIMLAITLDALSFWYMRITFANK
jgi:hypothetical protein